MARRIKPDIPPGAAEKIAKALDSIDAPKPRKEARTLTMRTFPPEQVAAVRNAEARAILTRTGLPHGGVVPFYPAEELRPMEVEPAALVVGNWGREGIVIGVHTVDGRALGHTRWSPPIYPVNTSLRRFVECVEAINRAAPFTPERYGANLNAAGEQVLAELRRIDPEELGDPDSFWLDIVDEIKVGNFTPSE